MKQIALVLAAAACGAVVLQAVGQQATAEAKPAPPTTGEEEQPEPAKPQGPRYRVIGATGAAQLDKDAWEKRRLTLEAELNKADADGYRVASMNNEWIILERRDPAIRRRVVLPTTPQ